MRLDDGMYSQATDAIRDEMGVLSSEVEDGDGVGLVHVTAVRVARLYHRLGRISARAMLKILSSISMKSRLTLLIDILGYGAIFALMIAEGSWSPVYATDTSNVASALLMTEFLTIHSTMMLSPYFSARKKGKTLEGSFLYLGFLFLIYGMFAFFAGNIAGSYVVTGYFLFSLVMKVYRGTQSEHIAKMVIFVIYLGMTFFFAGWIGFFIDMDAMVLWARGYYGGLILLALLQMARVVNPKLAIP